MPKFLELLEQIKYSIQRKMRNTLCILNAHDWIYEFNEKGQPNIRYCENCRRQEKYSSTYFEYMRIKDRSYMEM